MPEVSVIVPAFRRRDTIMRALDSALGQTFSDLEVVVVDDGSGDGTAEAAQARDDPRLRVIRHAANRGAAAARNTGIQASRGRFVAFLDSDDEWFPNKLEVQLPALRAAPDDVAVSCTGVYMHLLDHGREVEIRPSGTDDWRRSLALGCNLSPGTTLLARRKVFDLVGPLDETLPRFEDWDWLLRYARTGRILPVGEVLAHVYNRRGRLGSQVELSARRFIMKHRDEFSALDPRARRQAIADIWMQVAGTYAFEGRRMDAFRTILAAAAWRPIHTAARLVSAVSARSRPFAGGGA